VRRSDRYRVAGLTLSVAATAAIVGWALAQSSARSVPAVGLTGIVGVVTFAAALGTRNGLTLTTGLMLVGAAAVIGTLRETADARAGTLAVAGAVLFCAAELADRTLGRSGQPERRRGVGRWDSAWVVGVAAGSAGASYWAASESRLVAGGGPAALVAGTAAAALVVILAARMVRTRQRTGP